MQLIVEPSSSGLLGKAIADTYVGKIHGAERGGKVLIYFGQKVPAAHSLASEPTGPSGPDGLLTEGSQNE